MAEEGVCATGEEGRGLRGQRRSPEVTDQIDTRMDRNQNAGFDQALDRVAAEARREELPARDRTVLLVRDARQDALDSSRECRHIP